MEKRNNIILTSDEASCRLEYVDIAKGIGIFLVVLGHCFPVGSLPRLYIYTFHMPLFFFLSGLCFNDTKYPLFLPFLKRRVRTLLLPFVYFYVIGILGGCIIFGPEEYMINKWRPGNLGTTWFIYVLFLSELCYWLINRLIHRSAYRVVVLLFFFAIGVALCRKGISLHLSQSTVFAATFFYGVGHLCRGKLSEQFTRIPVWVGGWGLIIPFISVYYTHKSMEMINNSIPSPAMWTCVLALLGTMGILVVARVFTQWEEKYKKAILYMGKNTLVILWLHWYIVGLSECYILPHISSPLAYLVLEQIIIWIILVVCIGFINKKIPWLVGKNKK